MNRKGPELLLQYVEDLYEDSKNFTKNDSKYTLLILHLN